MHHTVPTVPPDMVAPSRRHGRRRRRRHKPASTTMHHFCVFRDLILELSTRWIYLDIVQPLVNTACSVGWCKETASRDRVSGVQARVSLRILSVWDKTSHFFVGKDENKRSKVRMIGAVPEEIDRNVDGRHHSRQRRYHVEKSTCVCENNANLTIQSLSSQGWWRNL